MEDIQIESIKAINILNELIIRVNTETKYAAFIYVMGHIQKIEVNIAKSKSEYNIFIYSSDDIDFYDIEGINKLSKDIIPFLFKG